MGGGGSSTLAYSKEYFTGGQPYIYTVVVPIPLAINNTVTIQTGSTSLRQSITKIYLAQLVPQSQQIQPPQTCNTPAQQYNVVRYNLTSGYISAQGLGYATCTVTNVKSITISAQATSQLYPQQFFIFPSSQSAINPPPNTQAWQLQLYVGEVGLGGV
ncbi:MAG: hypothetical protein QW613_07365 [Thermoprotei archaeon]